MKKVMKNIFLKFDINTDLRKNEKNDFVKDFLS